MPLIHGRPRRCQQRRRLVPVLSSVGQPDHEAPRQASLLGSFKTLKQALPQHDDDLFDICSVAGSETSLDPYFDSASDFDDSCDDSDEDSDDDSSGEGDGVGGGTSYHQLISQYEENGPVLANRGDVAEKMIRTEERKWIEFCHVLTKERCETHPAADPVDPNELLKRCHAPTFKGYLHWRCKNSRIKKESSIVTYWKVLSMLYSDKCATWMGGEILFDIGNWIPVVLVPEFGLATSIKNKSGLYVGDLDLMLHHHWVLDQNVFAHELLRVEVALALVLAGATATRPRALIEQLCYKDVEFHVFPPAPGSKRARIGMVVTLRKTKRTAGKSIPKKYGFHEEDTLLHDPILYMESIAFADRAFESDFKSPEDIYDLQVPAGQPRMKLPWKEEWRDRPIFRDVKGRGKNVGIAVDRALPCSKARTFLIKLGRALGYEKVLEWYDLRRGSGKKLNKALTPEERNQSMGHTLGDSSTYVKFYMTDFIEVDFQEVVFGSEPQRDLIQLMGRLMRRSDAPTDLTDEQRAEINKTKKLSKLRQRKQQVVKKLNKNGWTLKTAPDEGLGAKLLEQYSRFARQADTLRKTLYDNRLTRAINEFHASKDGEEIARQLNGIEPSECLAPPTVHYQLPTRARIAKLFSEVSNITSQDALFTLRMQLVREIAQLCKQRELSRRQNSKGAQRTTTSKTSATPKVSNKAVYRRSPPAKPKPRRCQAATDGTPSQPRKLTLPKASSTRPTRPRAAKAIRLRPTEMAVLVSPPLICPFCAFECAMDGLVKHIMNQHGTDKPFHCPYASCTGIVGGAEYFEGHIERQHTSDNRVGS